MTITLTEIGAALDSTLATAVGLTYVHQPSELKESMQDAPVLQIYPESIVQDPSGDVDRTTFRAGVRQTVQTWHCDLYATQRRNLGEDMAALLPLVDAITNVLEAQDSKPYFGLTGIKAFAWTSQRVTFTYGQPEIYYTGMRFTLTLRIF